MAKRTQEKPEIAVVTANSACKFTTVCETHRASPNNGIDATCEGRGRCFTESVDADGNKIWNFPHGLVRTGEPGEYGLQLARGRVKLVILVDKGEGQKPEEKPCLVFCKLAPKRLHDDTAEYRLCSAAHAGDKARSNC